MGGSRPVCNFEDLLQKIPMRWLQRQAELSSS